MKLPCGSRHGAATLRTCDTRRLLSVGRHSSLVVRPPLSVIIPSPVIAVVALFLTAASAVASPGSLEGTALVTLPNGVRVITREQHNVPLVAVDVWVRAGSGRECAGESGAAHFLEHVLFKGTTTRGPGEVDAAIENLGATLNAGTMRDAAHFYTTVAAQDAGTAVDVLADVVQHPALAPAQIELERRVILDEMARSLNARRKQAVNALYASLFGGRPYGSPILGQVESLRKLAPETIAAFYHRWYAPNNTTVVLVGDFETAVTRAMVARAFGGWQQHDVPADALAAGQAQQRDTALVPDGGRAVAALGCAISAATDISQIAAGYVGAALLAGGEGSRLLPAPADGSPFGGRARATSPSIEQDVEAEYTPLRDGGVFEISATVAPDTLPAARARWQDALRKLRVEAVGATELAVAKRRVVGPVLYDLETVGGQARALGYYDMLHDYRDAMQLVDAVERATAADVAAFVQHLPDPGAWALAAVSAP